MPLKKENKQTNRKTGEVMNEAPEQPQFFSILEGSG